MSAAYGRIFVMPRSRSQDVHVGQEIRRLRLARGWSQEQLAEAAGGTWNQALVSQIEGGRTRNPGIDRISDLAAALETSVDRLLNPAPPLALVPDPPATDARSIERDLLAFAEDRPDIMRTLERLRDRNTEETYLAALKVIHRFLIYGIEEAADRFGLSEAPPPQKS